MKNLLLPLLGFVLFVSLTMSCKHEPIVPTNPGTNPNDTTNTDTTGQSIPCDSSVVYFQNSIKPLLNNRCAIPGCHDIISQSDGVVMTDYSNITNTADVRPGDPGGSDLYEVITETDPDKKMPPPSSGISLSNEEIEMIRLWIQQGAMDNSCNNSLNGCDTAAVSFSADVQPIISTYCEGCHSGGLPQGGINLSSYDKISTQALNGNLRGVVERQSGFVPMPYNGSPLSACDQAKIRNWVQAGAPNN